MVWNNFAFVDGEKGSLKHCRERERGLLEIVFVFFVRSLPSSASIFFLLPRLRLLLRILLALDCFSSSLLSFSRGVFSSPSVILIFGIFLSVFLAVGLDIIFDFTAAMAFALLRKLPGPVAPVVVSFFLLDVWWPIFNSCP